ncbi:hypothetical protein DVH24_020721 [Malus domestica]|uniref:Disease resistance N-terminal domain-containing protein n=1 Tax=Malus domestica TaxID=3750 RepID=A0A498J7P9_MALDO|nr:hypothetical protein DVH24_020721 [Malus domestica]
MVVLQLVEQLMRMTHLYLTNLIFVGSLIPSNIIKSSSGKNRCDTTTIHPALLSSDLLVFSVSTANRKMAEALIYVLLEKLASVTYQYVEEEVKLVLNAEKDVQEFEANLKAIGAVLEDAELGQVREASVRNVNYIVVFGN